MPKVNRDFPFTGHGKAVRMNNSTTSSGTPRTVLLATVGTSPAVLTETIWALAHPAKKDLEIVVPDEVIALTTLPGKAAIEKDLLGPGGAWPRLVAALTKEEIPVAGKLAFGEASIRLLDHGKEFLEDIRTGEENESVANLFLEEVTKVTETGNTRLFASIAGGRKTMGALLLSCMCLRGREQDHVLHILVNEPFESRLDPPFFFPEPKARHVGIDPKSGKKKAFRAADARLDLIDLPFVKMRGWYQDKFKELPRRYSELVRAAQSSGPAATPQKPMLKFDFDGGRLFVDETPVRLSPVEFLTLSVDLLVGPDNLASALVAVRTRVEGDFGWLGDFAAGTAGGVKFADASSAKGDLTHARSSLRGKLRAVPSLAPFVDDLVPRGAKHGVWPEARTSADIGLFRRKTGL